MTHQRDIGKFPTEKSPDPENGNPGVVRTTTGVELQSVLERILQVYYTPDPNVQSVAAPDIERSAAFRQCDGPARLPCGTAETEIGTPTPDMLVPLSVVGTSAECGAAP